MQDTEGLRKNALLGLLSEEELTHLLPHFERVELTLGQSLSGVRHANESRLLST